MTTALQRLTKHTSAMHSMHKSTQLTTLASRNSPTNVSVVANTVSVAPAPQYAPTAAHKCDVQKQRLLILLKNVHCLCQLPTRIAS